jgi:hypothetical protein
MEIPDQCNDCCKLCCCNLSAVGQGKLFTLAAAHPEAYTTLIDCCVRSEKLEADDMVAAAELLSPAIIQC